MFDQLHAARAPLLETGPSGGIHAYPDAQRACLAAELAACRARTMALFEGVEPELLRARMHAEFSPVGWHLGHIAFTEDFWLLAGGAVESGGALSLFTTRNWSQPHVREIFAGLRCRRG